MKNKGWLISFEGVDGAGKSTHIKATCERLASLGFEVVKTREPGGTPLAEKIRELVIHEPMDIKTEALLMYASRVEHVKQVILPALDRGACVVSDRFEDSSFAYQAEAGGLGVSVLGQLSEWSLQGFEPDLTFLFDLPVEISKQRIEQRAEAGDKFEAKPNGYIEAVRHGFLERARLFDQRVTVIDASKSESAVAQEVACKLNAFLSAKGVLASE